MNKKRVRKAVIAAAGFGTRFLPQTKALPKEMLPVVDKPIIQYIVEELVDAGIEDIVIVTGYHKRSIEDHFDQISGDLRSNLEQGGKNELLEATNNISELANFAYVRQKGPYGTATPLLNAVHLIGDEPFIYIFADDLMVAQPNAFKQMIDLHEELGGLILPCIEIHKEEDFDKYGIVAGDKVRDGVIRANNIVEKPGKANARSNFASVGAYLLTPDVFAYLEEGNKKRKDDEEFYLSTFGFEPMVAAGEPIFGCTIENCRRYDTGNKLEYLKTVVDFALESDEFGGEFRQYLHDRIKSDKRGN
jgi:UTP--glucose-1-phosphate uridylyltransferase